MENNIPASLNKQRNAMQLTINNPLKYGYTHTEIKKRLLENFSTLKYFCMADEIGENGTPHTHIYVCFSSRVRFSTMKKHFQEAHMENAFATVQENINYIKKTGKWENTEKSSTRVEGTFEDWGTPPTQRGNNVKMEELYQLISDGYSNAEILAINHDYILNIEKIDKVRTILLAEHYKSHRRLDLRVTYIWGSTGLGKTRGILDLHGDANVYRVNDYDHPFDRYECQPVIVFDEYRSQFRLSDFLNYTDIYPIDLPARYSNRYACYTKVYIVSNYCLEDQYREVQKEQPSSWKALLRRIHKVQIYKDDGTIDTYDSVESYLHRDQNFHPVTQEEQLALPFGNETKENRV